MGVQPEPRGLDAKVVAAELKKIEKKSGTLEPEEVVRVAANPKHPLHSEFEWDDSEAGHRYRINQARVLIRSVAHLVEVENKSYSIKAYVRDPDALPTESRYRSIKKIRATDSRVAVMEAERARVLGSLERARNVGASMGVSGDWADQLRKEVEKLWPVV